MKLNYNIMPSPDELTPDEAIIMYKDFHDGYIITIQDMYFKMHNYKKFIADINNEINELTKYDYSWGKNNTNYRFHSEKCRIYCRGNSTDIYVSAFVTSEETAQEIWQIYKRYTKELSNIEVYVLSFFMNMGRLDENAKQIKPEDLDYISNKYYPYIDTDIMFDQFFTGSENIFLIVGEPGLGKSKMSTLAIKHAHENPDKLPYDKMKNNPALEEQFVSIVYVKSVDVLINDAFWRRLETEQADLVIIDDLDYMLSKRDGEVQSAEDEKKNIFLNQFLSFTDGVEKTHTKFIITTNQSYEEIDSALLRKGRLFDILELRRLDKAEALKIWEDNGLKKKEFNQLFQSHEILPANLGSEIAKRLNKRIEKKTENYLKEDGISKVQKAGRSKKISL